METWPIITVSLNPAVDRVIEVENFAVGGHQVGRELARTAGGKGVNVTRCLAELGCDVVATGFLGRANREDFDSVLRHSRVRDAMLMLEGRTRENVTITDPVGQVDTHIRDRGLAVSGGDVSRLTDLLLSLIGPGAIAIFSGSTPPGMDADAFAAMVQRCIDAGARVAVDTSGGALSAMAGRRLWLVKPNAVELPLLVGRELPNTDEQLGAARGLTSHIDHVLFSRGSEGAAVFTSDGQAWHGRVTDVGGPIVSTVGCGDTLLGGYVAAIVGGSSARDALVDAVSYAAAGTRCGVPAEFRRDDAAYCRGHLDVQRL